MAHLSICFAGIAPKPLRVKINIRGTRPESIEVFYKITAKTNSPTLKSPKSTLSSFCPNCVKEIWNELLPADQLIATRLHLWYTNYRVSIVEKLL
ncbi:MAG: hypothetical protein ACYC64_09410 [Armatimonadota bacterium]